jgi:hypothetical protein
MILKRASFNDLVAAGAQYHAPSRPREPSLQIPLTTVNDSPDDFVVLDNAVLTPPVGVAWREFWVADAIQYMSPAWRTADWLPGGYNAADDTIDIASARLEPEATIREPLFYVDSTVGSYNFGHFMYDTMPYGLLFQNVRRILPELRPIIAPLKFPHQRQLFEAVFGSRYDRCAFQPTEAPLRAERLVVPRRLTNLDEPPWRLSFAGVRHIRAAALRRWGSAPSGFSDRPAVGLPHRPAWRGWLPFSGTARRAHRPEAADARPRAPLKIHLHRLQDVAALRQTGNLQGRNFSNIDALPAMLLRKGYVVYEPSLLPLDFLVPNLGQADSIVAIHGAGLANFVFSPPGTRIYEITGHEGTWRCLEALSTVLGHHFTELRQSRPADPANPSLDLAMLEAAL